MHNSAFRPNARLKKRIDRRDWLAQNHKKVIYCDNAEFLIYHGSGASETFAAATGENAAPEEERIHIGDRTCPDLSIGLKLGWGGPIEKGRDLTDFDSVDYNYSSVNVLGVPNVADP